MIEEKIAALGFSLETPSRPMGNYLPVLVDGDLVFTSGTSCWENGKLKYVGQVGTDLSPAEGYDAARVAVVNLLSKIKAAIGDLERIEQVLKVVGFVNAAPGFHKHGEVLNGASDFLVAVLGERGRHARSAIGASGLPMNIPVEIEMIVRIRTDR